MDYCRREIVNKFNFTKIKSMVIGGNERYESVYEALKVLNDTETSYVLIHDGARPFVDQNIIKDLLDNAYEHKACVVGVPVKDTIKIVGENNVISETPDRKTLYMIQTPQVFSYALIKEAYDKYMLEQPCSVTDDSMVVELMNSCSVKLIEGSYNNIKITTPEDLSIAENILNSI
jgi:2-C-methyl-D-erythritol 4-phosphate cytidylyltransferase